MAGRAESTVVYIAGAVQGIVLVTFPAASTIFTDPARYNLTTTEYGSLFLPQVLTAITAALAGTWLGRRYGMKSIYLGGLAASLAAMLLFLLSVGVMTRHSVAYPLLLTATAFLGAGFGLTVPALNSLTAAFHPDRVDASVLILNAILGVGTVLAPVFIAVFIGLGFWWGLPLTSALLLAALLLVSARLPLRADTQAVSGGARPRIPARFWLYATFAVLYGACETINGNWAQVDMTRNLGASATLAALSLTAFWAMVTAGRVLFAMAQHRLAPRLVYHTLPFLLAAVFVLISRLPAGRPGWAVLAFGLAGLGCSALLPLTISFGQEELRAISATVTGGVIACYQVGYGIAAFGVGPLLGTGIGLPTIYAAAAVVAVAMGVVSFAVARRS